VSAAAQPEEVTCRTAFTLRLPSLSPSSALPADLASAFGIDPATRLVWGAVRARIAHVPEGTPCGEPYAFPQVALREVLRARLGQRPAIDIWGDGSAVRHGFTRGTATAPPGIARASGSYLSKLHRCMLARYESAVTAKAVAAAAAGAPGGGTTVTPARHPLAALVAAADAELAASLPPAPAPGQPPAPAPGRPPAKVLLLERTGSRQVPNFGDLRDALAALPGVALRVFAAAEPGSQSDHLRAFADVDVIVGPHGAGLTNALTSWPGSVMVEFIPDSGLSEYWRWWRW
jgi:hypothetical protein